MVIKLDEKIDLSEPKKNLLEYIFFMLTRIFLAGIFLWAALDKTFGLNYSTSPENKWLFGFGPGSPTYGFLHFGAVNSPLYKVFDAMAGNAVLDWLFMIALYGLGFSLIFGIGRKIAGYGGFILLLLMWLAVAPWTEKGTGHNPVFDDHLVYGAFLLLFAHGTNIGWRLKIWEKVSKKFPFLD